MKAMDRSFLIRLIKDLKVLHSAYMEFGQFVDAWKIYSCLELLNKEIGRAHD